MTGRESRERSAIPHHHEWHGKQHHDVHAAIHAFMHTIMHQNTHRKVLGDAGEDALPRVRDAGEPAVHGLRRPDHAPAVHHAQPLVAQADACDVGWDGGTQNQGASNAGRSKKGVRVLHRQQGLERTNERTDVRTEHGRVGLVEGVAAQAKVLWPLRGPGACSCC